MPIGYLVSLYPASSHTFIRREVNALRAHGVDVRTFSVRTPRVAERTAKEDAESFAQTSYLLPMAPMRLVRAHLEMLLRNPIRYARTFHLALQHRVPGVRAFVWAIIHFAESMVLVRDLERQGITHLHNHFANSGATVGFLATRHLGMSWSLTLHGNSETDYPAGNLLPEKLAVADFVACVTHYGRAQAFRMISPELWHKLLIVRCGLDLRALPPAARRERPSSGNVRLVCVARLVPEKGHVGLLQAFAKANVEAAELILVGDGSERARIEATIAELGLSDRVQVRGRLPEFETLEEIAKSDVLVLSSFVEGLPVVLMEALALSLPVVAPWVAGIPELVEHDVNGLMFAPAHWDELAECLRRILSDAALRERLAGPGRAKIEREFEISRAVLPLLERYQAGKARAPSYAATPAVDHVHG